MERRDALVEHARQHVHHVCGVAVGVQTGGHDVGAEKRDDELQWREGAAALEQVEMMKVGRRREAVAGLDLQGGRAAGDDLRVGSRQMVEQRLVRSIAGGQDAGPDAAAASRDVRERCAREPVRVLRVTLAREQGVGVALDEAGQDGAPGRVERGRAVVPVAQHRLRIAGGDDRAVAHGHRTVGKRVEHALFLAPAGTAAIQYAHELSGVDDVEVGHPACSRAPLGVLAASSPASPPVRRPALSLRPAYCRTRSAGPEKS